MSPVDWNEAVGDELDPPTAKFQLESHSEDVELVFACPEQSGPVKVGELFFNGNEWLFIRINRAGEQLMDGFHYIPVDPEVEQRHRDMEAESRIKAQSEAVLEGHLAAIRTSRTRYREESRDVAKVGAVIQARKWWKQFHRS